MKKLMVLFLLSSTLLAGCASEKHEARYQDKGKTTFTNQNKDAHQKSSQARANNSSAQASAKKESTPSQAKQKSSSYKVPTKIQKNSHYVAHGNLTQPKQFSYDSFGTKVTLNKVEKADQIIISRPFEYRITQVRLLTNVAKTKKARQVVTDAFNNTNVSATYYTLQIKFTIQNKGTQQAVIGGLNYVKLSNDFAGTPLANLVDSSAGKRIGAHKTMATTAVVLVPTSLVHNLHSCTLQFASAYSPDGQELSKNSLATKLTF